MQKIMIGSVFTFLPDEIKTLQHFSSRTLMNILHIYTGMLTLMFISSPSHSRVVYILLVHVVYRLLAFYFKRSFVPI